MSHRRIGIGTRAKRALAAAVTAAVAGGVLAVGASGASAAEPVHTGRVCPANAVPSAGFEDMGGWPAAFLTAVNCVAWDGITRGTTATTYAPARPVTRSQAVLFMSRLVAKKIALPAPRADQASGGASWSDDRATAADQLERLGILNFAAYTSEDAHSPLRRAEIAVLAQRTLAELDVSLGSSSAATFDDIAAESAATTLAINQLAGVGVMIGVTETSFEPAAPLTRGQMALVLTRLFGLLEYFPGGVQPPTTTSPPVTPVTPPTPNPPPKATGKGLGPRSVQEGLTVHVGLSSSGAFSDPGDTLVYTASSSDPAKASVSVSVKTDRKGPGISILLITGVSHDRDSVAVVTVIATDEAGGSASVAFTVAVTRNAPPTVANGIKDQSVQVGATAAVDVSSNFSDPGDTLTFQAVSSDAAKVSVSVEGSVVSLTGAGAAQDSAVVTVTATDKADGSVTDTFTVAVAANLPPTAVAGVLAVRSQYVQKNLTRAVDMSGAFSDPGDTLTFQASSSDTAKVSVSVSVDVDDKGYKNYTLSLTGEAVGSADVTVTATDTAGGSGSSTFRVNVIKNTLPKVVGEIIKGLPVQRGATETFVASAAFSDPGDTLVFTASSSNTVAVSVSVSVEGSVVSFTGVAAGSAVVTVTATDKAGGSASVAFTVTVAGNVPPTVAAANEIKNQNVQVGATSAVDVSENFSDPGDTLTFAASSADPAKVSVSVAGSVVSFTAASAAVAEDSAVVTVTATDTVGGSVTDTFTVTVKPNQPPTVAAGVLASQSVQKGLTRAVDVSQEFSDPGDTLTYAASSSDTAIVSTSVEGSVVSLTGEAVGSANVTVTATDTAGALVTTTFAVYVTNNTLPKGVGGTIKGLSVQVDATKTFDASAAFSDPGDTLVFTAESSDTAKVSVSVNGSVVSSTGVEAGSAVVTVTATDKADGSASVAFTVTVTGNLPPVVVANAIKDQIVQVGATAAVDVSGAFSDPGDTLMFTASSSDTAKVSVSVAGSVVSFTAASAAVAQDSAVVTVTATDTVGGSVTATFTVTVVANQPPTVVAGALAIQYVQKNLTKAVDVSGAFSDPGDTLTFTAESGDEAKVSVSVTGSVVSLTGAGAVQDFVDVTVTATDADGPSVLSTFTVYVTDNKLPKGIGGAFKDRSVDVGVTKTVDVSGAFSDPGDTLVFTASSSDTTKVSVSVEGSVVSFTGAGAAQDSADVTVTATDKAGGSASVTFTVTVAPNRPPTVAIAILDQSVQVNLTKTVDVSSNFSDPDGDTLVFTAFSSDEAKVSVSVEGSVVSFTGAGVAQDSAVVTVIATDKAKVSVRDTFKVTVANAAPIVATPISDKSVQEALTKTVDVSGVFSDPGDTLVFTASSGDTTKVSVSVEGSVVSVTGAGSAEDFAVVTVTATDTADGSATDTFTVTVATNAAPTVATEISDYPGTYTVTVNGQPEQRTAKPLQVSATKTVDVYSSFSDSADDTLVFTASSGDTTKVSASVKDSVVSFTGVAVGSADVTVTATDKAGGSVTDTFAVTVVTNAAPTVKAAISNKSVQRRLTRTVDVSAFFSDPGDTLEFTANSSHPSSRVYVSVEGSVVSLTGVGSVGWSATITVTAKDKASQTVSTSFIATVATNAPPTIVESGEIADQTVVLSRSKSVDVSGTFADSPDDELTFTATATPTSLLGVSVYESIVTFTSELLSGDSQSQTGTVTVIATDKAGGSKSITFNVTVVRAGTPIVVSPIADLSLTVGAVKLIDLSNHFEDPDALPGLSRLEFTATASPTTLTSGRVSVSVNGSVLSIIARDAGLVSIAVKATNGAGNSVTDTFRVTVRPSR